MDLTFLLLFSNIQNDRCRLKKEWKTLTMRSIFFLDHYDLFTDQLFSISFKICSSFSILSFFFILIFKRFFSILLLNNKKTWNILEKINNSRAAGGLGHPPSPSPWRMMRSYDDADILRHADHSVLIHEAPRPQNKSGTLPRPKVGLI